MELFAPENYWSMDASVRDAICNGCGSANAKFDFVPEKVWGLSIHDACMIHDYLYHIGETVQDKQEADRIFLNNMLRIINKKGGWLRWLRRRRALKYYEAVVEFGGPAYWSGKN